MLGKGANRSARERDYPDWQSVPYQGDAEHRPKLRKLDGFCPSIFPVFEDVRDVDCFPFKRGTPSKRPALEWDRILFSIFYEIAGKSMSGGKVKEITKTPVDKAKIRVAQTGGGFQDRIEDRLQIKR